MRKSSRENARALGDLKTNNSVPLCETLTKKRSKKERQQGTYITEHTMLWDHFVIENTPKCSLITEKLIIIILS